MDGDKNNSQVWIWNCTLCWRWPYSPARSDLQHNTIIASATTHA